MTSSEFNPNTRTCCSFLSFISSSSFGRGKNFVNNVRSCDNIPLVRRKTELKVMAGCFGNIGNKLWCVRADKLADVVVDANFNIILILKLFDSGIFLSLVRPCYTFFTMNPTLASCCKDLTFVFRVSTCAFNAIKPLKRLCGTGWKERK